MDTDWRDEVLVSYTRRDLILYALGIGCSDLRFVYEDADGFSPFPTYPVVLGFKGDAIDVVPFPSPAMMQTQPMVELPGVRTVLDAERYIELVKPLPSEGGSFNLRSKVVSIQQKSKGALIHFESELRNQHDELFYRLVAGAFAIGAHSFSSAGTPPAALASDVQLPTRSPDAMLEEVVGLQQAQIYRLSGDYNALHIDPDAAQMAGFDKPILHGLCTLGIAVRMVLSKFAPEEKACTEFKAVRCRFVGPVRPGETLLTKMWVDGSKILFTTEIKELSKVVIANAFVQLHGAPRSVNLVARL
ncbi:hypothetical protein AB1Y20_009140 [Prymnesium parvum]|uniref:MaoC-like domain-containing protein n=1 Tax=Prymnesium parvum TaxID=97485 RepID=A0AB34K4U1_PRYPA